MKTIYQATIWGISVLILAAALVPSASAHEPEDVSFTGDGLSASFATAILPNKIPIGQTFIPNADNLVAIDLTFQTGQSIGNRTVTVEIREGGILGPVVGQKTDTFFVPGTGPFIHHFDFESSVPLTPGLTYAIQVPLVDISLVGVSSLDPMDPLLYPDGAFFQGGFDGPEPGGATFLPNFDLVFTTYAFGSGAGIAFDFESVPDEDDGNGVNPVFIKDGFTLTHTVGAGFGVAQWTNNFGVPAFSGIGTLRLSAAAPAPHFFLTARVDFSEPVTAVSLQARDFSGTSNFTISALSPSDTVLGTFTVTSVGTYEFVEFRGIGTIAALLYSANNANQASWDNLTVSRIPVPDGENIIIDPGFITAIAENVVQAGTIDFEFCVAVLDSLVGKQAVSLSRYSNTGTCGELHDVLMPVGFEPYPDVDGKLALGVVAADSNVLFDGLILEVQDIVAVLGRDLACSTVADRNLDDPRVLGLSDLDFLPKAMHLQTGECNRARSVRPTYSTTVFPLRFTGNGRMLAVNQVQKIRSGLSEASCIGRSVLAQLDRTLNQIKRKINGKKFLSAQDKFIDFALIAQNNPDAFVSCPLERNFRGLFTSDGIIGAFIVSEEILDNRFVIPPEINLPEEEEPEG